MSCETISKRKGQTTMKTHRQVRTFWPLAIAAMLLSVAFHADAQGPGDSVKFGKQIYMDKCSSCHGADARGNGPVAEWLSLKPTNLRLLAKENGGQYPFGHVYAVVEGRAKSSGDGPHERIRGHGTRDMPIWGKHFKDDAAQTAGSEAHMQEVVHGRILGLVYYLQTIQE